jgi:hypothetical protein
MLQKLIAMFTQINIDCASTGANVVPLTADNIDYYEEQMENLEYTDKAIQTFSNWLTTQH